MCKFQKVEPRIRTVDLGIILYVILVVYEESMKTVKVMQLENLVLYGSRVALCVC